MLTLVYANRQQTTDNRAQSDPYVSFLPKAGDTKTMFILLFYDKKKGK